MLPEEMELNNPKVIPASWYRYKRQDVDTNTRRNAVKEGYERWIDWETQTKALYEKHSKALLDDGAVAAAIVVGKLADDVSDELADAEKEKLELEAMDYDPTGIIDMQSKTDFASKVASWL